jgi:hypothetical protein
MVGISLAASLRRIFEKTRTKDVHGPLREVLDSRDYPMQYTEKFVTFNQWKQIIHNFLSLQKEGKEFKSIDEMLSAPKSQRQFYSGLDLDSEEGEEDSLEGNEEAKSNMIYRRNQFEEVSDDEEEDEDEDQEEEEEEDSQEQEEGSDDRNQRCHRRRFQKKSPLTHSKSYFKNLKNVKSRLSDVIRHDKKQFYQDKSQTEHKALTAIAKKRLDEIISKPRYPSVRDPNFFSEKEKGVNRKNLQNPMGEIKKAKQKIERMKELTSGTAALQIADAFISSRVGQELISATQSDGTDDISQEKAEYFATKLLGNFGIIRFIFQWSFFDPFQFLFDE